MMRWCMERCLPCVIGLLCLATPATAQYAVFDQVSDTIAIPGNTTVGGALTIEARVRFCESLPSTDAHGHIFAEQESALEEKTLRGGATGIVGWAHRGLGEFPLGVTVPVSENVWHHVAFVVQGSEERLYLDGVLAGSRVLSGSVTNSAGSAMAVGALRDVDAPPYRNSFRGVLDEVRVSNVVRYSGSAFNPPTGDLASDGNTVLLYHFNGNANDSSPSGFHGTLGIGFSGATSPLITDAAGIAFCKSPGKFHYSLKRDTAQTLTGTQWIALPRDIAVPTLPNCQDLRTHIPNAVTLSRYDPATDTTIDCSCPGVNCFLIVQGRGYQVRLQTGAGASDSIFELTGTDDSPPILLDLPASGTHLISLPFGTPIVNASDLATSIGGLSTSGGPVVQVQRYLTQSDSLQVFPPTNFPIAPGQGYRVRVNRSVVYRAPFFDGDYCDTPTSCFFQGRAHTALEDATLALNDAGQLVVANIGTSGLDGVQIAGSGSLPLTTFSAHEPWIPLGVTATQTIPIGTTASDARLTPRSFASLVAFTMGTVEIAVDLTENATNQIEIRPDFSASGTTNLCYALRNNQLPADPTFSCGHPQTSPVLASDWPVREAFSVIQWASDVSVTLPGGSAQTADELWIRPDGPTLGTVESVDHLDLTARCGPSASSCATNPGLTSFTLVEAAFITVPQGEELDPLPPGVFPGGGSYHLSVSTAGSGTVTASGSGCPSPCGINCQPDCAESYPGGSTRTLTATPAVGFQFSGYTGHADCTDGVIAMSGSRSCTATFNSVAGGGVPALSGWGLLVTVLLMLAVLSWFTLRRAAGPGG